MKKFIFFFFFLFLSIYLQVLSQEIHITESIIIVLYLVITLFADHFKLRFDNLFLPQNFIFIIFFIRLYLLPCLGFFFEYRIFSEGKTTEPEFIFLGYLITLLMYFAFVVGWEFYYNKSKGYEKKIYTLDQRTIKYISFSYLLFGLIVLALYYKSFNDYLFKIFISNIDIDGLRIVEDTSLLSVFAGFSKFFLPIAVFGFISLIDMTSKTKISINIILLISFFVVLLFSLDSNRQNMVYPIMALFAGFSKIIKFKPIQTLLFGFVALYFLFMFSNIRVSEEVDLDKTAKNSEEIIYDVQVYAGGSQMIAPVFKADEKKFTIFNSFISSFPILGTSFRENSGVKYYSYLFYGYDGPHDQIFLTQAECYSSGGYILVLIFFLIVGFYIAYLNRLYEDNLETSQFLFRTTLFYLILLMNASILLSFQVLGQFLFYNAIPALIIMYFYKKVESV